VPTDTHGKICVELLGQSYLWIHNNDLALHVGTKTTYIVSDNSVLEPDGNITPRNRNPPLPGTVCVCVEFSLHHNTTHPNTQAFIFCNCEHVYVLYGD
jgi:Uma2 family endonuclease